MEITVQTPWTCSEKIMLHNRAVMKEHWINDFISQGHSSIPCDGEGDNFCSGDTPHKQYRGILTLLFPTISEGANEK